MTSSGITPPFDELFRCPRYVTYPFLTLSPLTMNPITLQHSSFDLHVLAMPPAFILSQDQTLQFVLMNPSEDGILLNFRINLKSRSRNEKTKLIRADRSRRLFTPIYWFLGKTPDSKIVNESGFHASLLLSKWH